MHRINRINSQKTAILTTIGIIITIFSLIFFGLLAKQQDVYSQQASQITHQ